MQIDRYMVNLFFEIKRNSPKELQSSLKISDPELINALTHLYKNHPDEAIQRLVEVFFERSGKESLGQFKAALKNKTPRIKEKQQNKKRENSDTAKAKAPRRYYRGALVDG